MREKLMELLAGTGSDLALRTIVLRILAACVVSCFIYLSYWASHSGGIYSKKFNVSLVGLTLITAMVMIVIGNNLALSLGMVGALSIVRFRTAIKDSRDTVYIFWAIVVGICCGAGDYLVAAVGSAFVFVMLLLFGRIRNENRILLIIRAARTAEGPLEDVVSRHCGGKAVLRVKNTTVDSVEFIYEIGRGALDKAQKDNGSITDGVYAIDGVEYFNIVTQSDEIGS